MKVIKKEKNIVNVVIYLILSFLFLYIQHAYRHNLSPFSFVYFKKSIELFWYVIVVLLVSGITIWNHHRFSIALYKFSIFLVGFKVLEGLFIEFNKVIVVATFFYAIISYFLYQLLNQNLSSAAVNQNFRSSDLFQPLLKKIECSLIQGEKEYKGTLSNWDDDGCFVKLDQPLKITGVVQIRIYFSDRQFDQEGEVVASTADLTGVGVKFEQSVKKINVFNWAEFIEIMEEIGFKPERLR